MPDDTETSARAEDRIRALTTRLGEAEKQLKAYAEGETAKRIQSLEAQLAAVTTERDTARTDLQTRTDAWTQEKVMLANGITSETDGKALKALHAVYGEGKTLDVWLKAKDALPAAAKALLPSDAPAGDPAAPKAPTAPAGTDDKPGTLPRDSGAKTPGAPNGRSLKDLARLPAPDLQKLAKEAGGLNALMKASSKGQSAA